MTETKFVYPVGNYSILLLQENDQVSNVASAALLILLVLTLTLNTFVLLSVIGSPLRASPHNSAIATIACVSLVDGVFNLTSSVVFQASWPELPRFYSEDTVRMWCRSNAALLQITGSVLSFASVVISYDRLSVIDDKRVGDVPVRRQERHTALKWILLLSVFGSAILALPIMFGVLDTVLFEQRMSCSPAYASKQPESVFIAVVILIIHLGTWFFTLRNGYTIARRFLNERRRMIGLELVARQRAAERGSPPRGIANSNSDLWCQIWGTGESLNVYILTALLIVSFMVAVVPNIIFIQVTQFYTAYDLEEEFYMLNRTLTQTDLRQARTDVFDSIFAWTRHGYNVFSPGLILLLHDEIRKQCKITFCCCCVGGNTYIRRQSRSVSAFVRDWKRQKKKKTMADYRTPVLFATSQGLHLRTVRGDRLEQEEPEFVLTFCDLTLEESSTKQHTPVQVQPRQLSNLNETFVVRSSGERRLDETYVKCPNGFDVSKNSRNRTGTIELRLIAENGCSLLSLSQRMRNRDS